MCATCFLNIHTAANMITLPQEIYDEIIGLTDFITAVKAHHSRASAQLYDKNVHTWEWAAEGGHLDVLKWLQKNHVGIRRRDVFEPHAEYNVLHAAWHAGHEHVVAWLLKNRPEMQIACQRSVDLMVAFGATVYLASPRTKEFEWLQGVKWPIGLESRTPETNEKWVVDAAKWATEDGPRSLDSAFRGLQ